jgi:hypothetical protein
MAAQPPAPPWVHQPPANHRQIAAAGAFFAKLGATVPEERLTHAVAGELLETIPAQNRPTRAECEAMGVKAVPKSAEAAELLEVCARFWPTDGSELTGALLTTVRGIVSQFSAPNPALANELARREAEDRRKHGRLWERLGRCWFTAAAAPEDMWLSPFLLWNRFAADTAQHERERATTETVEEAALWFETRGVSKGAAGFKFAKALVEEICLILRRVPADVSGGETAYWDEVLPRIFALYAAIFAAIGGSFVAFEAGVRAKEETDAHIDLAKIFRDKIAPPADTITTEAPGGRGARGGRGRTAARTARLKAIAAKARIAKAGLNTGRFGTKRR